MYYRAVWHTGIKVSEEFFASIYKLIPIHHCEKLKSHIHALINKIKLFYCGMRRRVFMHVGNKASEQTAACILKTEIICKLMIMSNRCSTFRHNRGS